MPVGGYLLAIRPIDQRRALVAADTQRLRGALANLNRSTSAISDSSQRASQVSQAIDRFETRLPAGGQMDKVLEEVWQLAQANSLQTKTVRTPAVQRNGGYSEQTMDLSLSGDFGGFYQFLLQLEDAKHVIRIRKMHVGGINDHDGEIQADLTLGVFFKPNQEGNP